MYTRSNRISEQHFDPDVQRIYRTLNYVAEHIESTDLLHQEVTHAANGDPTTALDLKINDVIRHTLPSPGEGWLSEETFDDLQRLQHRRVWIVDPIDGTREFVEGIPEWCVSIGLIEDKEPIAGGVLNPCTGEMVLGSRHAGVNVLKLGSLISLHPAQENASVLVSRREYKEGKWQRFEEAGLKIKPVGSIAYRLARVAIGLAHATCTFEARSEWDIAAGVALIHASGGRVETANGKALSFNGENPRLESLFAFARNCPPGILDILGRQRST
jgi:myo-inositol-1(or 4)-monophosphatase